MRRSIKTDPPITHQSPPPTQPAKNISLGAFSCAIFSHTKSSARDMLKSQKVGFQTLKLFIAQSIDPINTVLKKNEKKKAN